jgi:putative pyrimidine permease RutG
MILYPEDRIPLPRLVPLGMQHVVAMFGATVLAPILMGFNPQVALFFSGVGTLIFILITGFKVPSYLGSSFAFIGPVLAVTGGDATKIPYALCGIAGAAVLYGIAAVVTIRWGSGWIDRLMPPVVTGSVVALIGLNLAAAAVADATNAKMTIATSADVTRLVIAAATFLTAALVAIHLKGFLRLLPILIGVIVGYVALDALRRGRLQGTGAHSERRMAGSAALPVAGVQREGAAGHRADLRSFGGREQGPHRRHFRLHGPRPQPISRPRLSGRRRSHHGLRAGRWHAADHVRRKHGRDGHYWHLQYQ